MIRILACCLLCGALAAATVFSDPVLGRAGNDGSVGTPWPGLAEVASGGLLARLKGGDTLLLRSGDHGEVSIGGDNAGMVTIAADAKASPHLARLTVTGRNWTIRGLTISVAFAKAPYTGFMASLGERAASSDLVIEDCFVYGALDHGGWSAKDWMEARNGIQLGRNGNGLIARNNYVLNVRFGIGVDAPGSIAEGNVVSDFSADGMRLTRDGTTAQGNVIKNCYLSKADGDENHDDGIQCFLFNKGTGTMRNLTIRDNLIISREDPAQAFPHDNQGIGLFDGPLIGFTVSGNVVRSATWHGVSLYDAQDCTVSGNACWTEATSGPRPWVMFGTKLKQVGANVAKGNLACAFNFKDAPKAELSGNQLATAATFNVRLEALRAAIDAKYGRIHPVTGRPRLGAATAP